MAGFKEFMKESMDSHTDCAICRALSSSALVLSGLFLFQHRNNFGKVNSVVQSAFAGGIFALGLARGFGLPPFTSRELWERTYHDEDPIDKRE